MFSVYYLVRRLRLDYELMFKVARLKVLLKELMFDPGGVKVEVVSKIFQPFHPLLLLHLGLGVLQVPLHLVTCLQEINSQRRLVFTKVS